MLTALLLINTKSGRETHVLGFLKVLSGVEYAYPVYGTFDIIAKIEAESREELQKIIDSQIRKSKEIKSSIILIVVPEKANVVVLRENPRILA